MNITALLGQMASTAPDVVPSTDASTRCRILSNASARTSTINAMENATSKLLFSQNSVRGSLRICAFLVMCNFARTHCLAHNMSFCGFGSGGILATTDFGRSLHYLTQCIYAND